MTLSAKEFWTKTELTAVEALANDYNGYIKEDANLRDLYIDDLADVETAVSLFRSEHIEELADHVAAMDTYPREKLVLAFAKDCGDWFAPEILGWNIL